MKLLFKLSALCALVACTQMQPAGRGGALPLAKPLKAQCGKRMCTMQYQPVCATIRKNGQTIERTFGNRCSVCSGGGEILSVLPGACGSLH